MSKNGDQFQTVENNADTYLLDNNLNSADKCSETNTAICLICNQTSGTNINNGPLQPSASNSTIVPPLAPNGGYGWIIVLASFVINLIADGIGFSFGVLYIELLHYFGESKGKTALVGSLFYSIPLMCGPIASVLIDRYGCRKMTIIGGILASVGFVLSAFAPSLEVMFLTFGIISGFGLALSYVAAIVIVAFYFDSKRGFATGLSVCGTGIGTFVFAPLVTYLIEEYSWRGAVLILGGIFLNITVCGAVVHDLEWVKHKRKKSLLSSNASSQPSPLQCCCCEDPVASKLFVPDCDRLSNSLFQLPTYINHSNVLSDWTHSKKEEEETKCAGNDSSADTETAEKVSNNRPRVPSKRLRLKKFLVDGEPPGTSMLHVSSSYLQNIKLHRHSLTYRGAMLNIHRYQLKASSCPDIYQNTDSHNYSTDQVQYFTLYFSL